MEKRFAKATSPLDARSRAERWLAQFAPVLEPDLQGAAERLQLLQTLRREGESVQIELSAWASEEDQVLLSTLREALEHLKTTEASLKQELAAKQDAHGALNLTSLRSKIAEAAARQELGAVEAIPEKIELLLSGGNLVVAAGTASFALFWNGFTLVHATFMIGGMWKAFGPLALFLLAFYSLFLGVGFAMAKTAVDAASKESLELVGRTLVLRKTLGLWVREKRVALGPQSRVSLDVPAIRQKGSRAMTLTVNDAEGRSHPFGVTAPEHLKGGYVKQLNTYLAAMSS